MKQPLDHLRSRKKPVSKTVWIALDSDLADEFNAANDRANDARARADANPNAAHLVAKASELEEEAERLREAALENSAKFICKSLGRKAFQELQDAKEHIPTKEQRSEAKRDGLRDLAWNPETFPPALILACTYYACDFDEESQTDVLEPLTEEFVKELWDGVDDDGEPKWNHAEVMRLFTAALEANQTHRVIDLGNGSRQTRA